MMQLGSLDKILISIPDNIQHFWILYLVMIALEPLISRVSFEMHVYVLIYLQIAKEWSMNKENIIA